jgi:hypothetical protein
MNNIDKLLIMRSKISHEKFSSHAWEEFRVVSSSHVQLPRKWEEKLFIKNGPQFWIFLKKPGVAQNWASVLNFFKEVQKWTRHLITHFTRLLFLRIHCCQHSSPVIQGFWTRIIQVYSTYNCNLWLLSSQWLVKGNGNLKGPHVTKVRDKKGHAWAQWVAGNEQTG